VIDGRTACGIPLSSDTEGRNSKRLLEREPFAIQEMRPSQFSKLQDASKTCQKVFKLRIEKIEFLPKGTPAEDYKKFLHTR
jgi:hypothetical protein